MASDLGTVTFNVGGKRYDVSLSLIERFPSTMLARMTSELWSRSGNRGDGDAIFVERDGDRFRYILDYMRDGHAFVPPSVPREAVIRDLEYFGFSPINPAAIETCGSTDESGTSHFLAPQEVAHFLADECAKRHVADGTLTVEFPPLFQFPMSRNHLLYKATIELDLYCGQIPCRLHPNPFKAEHFLANRLARFGLVIERAESKEWRCHSIKTSYPRWTLKEI